ncbi:MAG: GerMN domain-containing protein [Mobilitalea sp.]
MKRFSRNLLFLFLIGILLFQGCNVIDFGFFDASTEDIEKTPTSTPEITDAAAYEADGDKVLNESSDQLKTTEDPANSSITLETPTPTISLIAPTANIDLNIYTVNPDSGDIKIATVRIPQDVEITPELIVNNVVESLLDQSIVVGIKDVTTRDDIVIVNFDKEKTPFNNNLGSEYETSVLDAIAQSLIDNLTNYKKVIFRVDDKAYESGVNEFGIDDVYLGGD